MDASGTIFVADTLNMTVRRVAADGTTTTLAGRAGVSGWRDGKGAEAQFSAPADMTLGKDGSLYLVDNTRLRRITLDGTVTTVGADLPNRVGFYSIAVAPDGSMYAASQTAVYRLGSGGEPTLLAGIEGAYVTNDGVGAAATFLEIDDIAVDAALNVYVSQPRTQTIRRITADGTVTTFAGSGRLGSVDGNGRAAQLSGPEQLALDAAGNLWFEEGGGSTFRRITPQGDVTTPFGRERGFFPGYGTPVAIAFGPGGALYFAVGAGVNRLDVAGVLTPIAGHDFVSAPPIGQAMAVGVDPAGNIELALRASSDKSAVLFQRYAITGERLVADARVGPFSYPFSYAAFDPQGNAYVSSVLTRRDTSGGNPGVDVAAGGVITRVSAADGVVSTLLQWLPDSPGAMVPVQVAVGRDGALYFIDSLTLNLVKWTAGAGFKMLVRLPSYSVSFSADADGTVYVSTNSSSHPASIDYVPVATVSKLVNGALVPFAGAPGELVQRDGTGTQAGFASVGRPTIDAQGNVYVADGALVRKITPAGVVTTVAGQIGSVGFRPGPLPGSLSEVGVMAFAPDGVLHLVSGGALVRIRF